MKSKLFLLMFCMVLLVGTVSALDWDNDIDYSNDDLTVTIKNYFGLFSWLPIDDTIGEATLKSHKTPTEVRGIMYGEDRVVMYYDFKNWKEDKGTLGQVYFTNMKTGEPIEKNYYFAKAIYEDVEVQDYNVVCELGECRKVESGTHIENKLTRWEELTNTNIPKEDIRIGLVTDVAPRDYVDAVWTIAGEKVKKHSSWYDYFETDLNLYFNMSDLTDYMGNQDLMFWEGSDNWTTAGCLIDDCAGMTQDAGHFILPSTIHSTLAYGDHTWNFWVKLGVLANNHFSVNATPAYLTGTDGNGDLYVSGFWGSPLTTSFRFVVGNWTMVSYVHNGTSFSVYLNSVLEHTDTSALGNTTTDMSIGIRNNGNQDTRGFWDEMSFYSRALNESELLELWNEQAGLTRAPPYTDLNPNVTLNSPIEAYNSSTPIIDFNCSAWDDINLVNVSLEINGTVEQTNSSGINNTAYVFTETLASAGYYTWRCSAWDNNSQETTSGSRTFTYNNDLAITLNSPVEAFNNSVVTVIFNGTASDDTAVINISLYINETLNQTNITPINNTPTIFTTNLADGYYNWSLETCDAFACLSSSTRNLTVDITAPTVLIEYPLNNSVLYTTNLTYNVTLNYTVSDNVLLHSCWYNNETDNISLACGVNGSVIADAGYTTITWYANDTAGNEQSNYTRFFLNVYRHNVSFTDPIAEGQADAIRFNFTAGNIDNLTAILEYNNTNYSMTEANLNATYGNFTYTITSPIVSLASEIPLKVHFVYNGLGYNTSNFNQTVNFINPLNVNTTCPAGLSPAMHFNFSDAQNLSALNASIDYNFQFGITNSTYKTTTGTLTNIGDFYLCVNTTVSTNYSLGYGEIDYSKAGWSERRWYAFNTQRLTDKQTNNTLHLLLDSASTSFLVTIQDPTLTAYTGKYTALLRWYTERNEYKVVEMGITDGKGQTVKKVEIEDIDYRIGIYEVNGSLIYLASPIRMVCLASPCTYLLSVTSTAGVDYGNYIGTIGTIIYDSTTGVFSYAYNDPSQSVSLMELNVSRVSGSSETVICTANSTGFTGVLTCNISGQTGLFKATAFRSASPERISDILWVDNITTVFQGTMGLFIVMIIALVLFLIGIYAPIASLVLGILALIPALFLKVITYPIMLAVGVMGGIVIYFMKEGAGQ